MSSRSISTTQFKCSLTGTVVNTLDDGSTASSPIAANISQSVTTGVQEGQANRAWVWKDKILNAGVSQVIDLYDFAGLDLGAGLGKDAVGQEMSPIEEIIVIIIKNENVIGTGAQLEVEPDATNGWTPMGTHTAATGGALYGQGVLVKCQFAEGGFDVEDGVSHRIKLTAVTNSVTYSLWILARHDDEESSSSISSSSSVSSSSSTSSSSESSASSPSSASSSSESSASSSSVSSSESGSSSSSSISTSSVSTSSTSSSSESSESSSSWSSHSSSPSSASTSSSSPSSQSLSSSSWSS